MSVKIYNIKIPQLDYQLINVSILENGSLVELEENDKIFMTVKKNYSCEDYIFQKSLDDGITYDEDTGKYQIEINSEDTENMIINKSYYYDIVIFYDSEKPKQKITGTFNVTAKYTTNEVVE